MLKANILFVGWLETHKGILELISAVSLLKKANINFHLTVVGQGHAEKQCEKLAHKLGVSGNITFCGWLERKELLKIYSVSDIFVLPSWHEGLPNSMIEAMACGLPAILTQSAISPIFLMTKRIICSNKQFLKLFSFL